MSQAEDLLNSLTEDEVAAYSVDTTSEPHIVINADRTVTVPEELKHIAVQGDHNIETVTFDCPRHWDGHDLSDMNLRIVFQRPDGHKEPHPVENLRVDETDTNTIHFDWTISGNVTLVRGNISFTVCGKLANTEGIVEREWHTRLNQDLIVDEGMDCSGDEIVEQNPDIIESILVRLDLAEQGGVSDEQIAAAVESYMAEHPIEAPDSGQNPTVGTGWTAEQINRLDQLFDYIPWTSSGAGAIADALIASLRSGDTGGEEEPDTPVEPDEPVDPEVTLSSISVAYSGGSVPVGTAVSALTGVVVTAYYSDGSTATVTGYTLSGTIAEGSNTVTVTYQGKTASFTVTGVAESGGDEVFTCEVFQNLTNITSSNDATSTDVGKPYEARLTADDGYWLDGFNVEVGFNDGSSQNITNDCATPVAPVGGTISKQQYFYSGSPALCGLVMACEEGKSYHYIGSITSIAAYKKAFMLSHLPGGVTDDTVTLGDGLEKNADGSYTATADGAIFFPASAYASQGELANIKNTWCVADGYITSWDINVAEIPDNTRVLRILASGTAIL